MLSLTSLALNKTMISASLLAFFTLSKSSIVDDGLDSTSPSFKTTVSTSFTSLSFSYGFSEVSSSLLSKLFFSACSSIFRLSSILFALDLNQSSVKIDIVFAFNYLVLNEKGRIKSSLNLLIFK